jgi:hypothetical protein
MSRVIETLDAIKEYDRISGGNISVTHDQIRFVGNDGSLFYIDFARPILDLLRGGGSSTVSIRSR